MRRTVRSEVSGVFSACSAFDLLAQLCWSMEAFIHLQIIWLIFKAEWRSSKTVKPVLTIGLIQREKAEATTGALLTQES